MTATAEPQAHPHPVVFSLLIIPFGAVSGYVTVALAYSLSQSGMTVAQIGILSAIYFTPQTWKFLWAPVVDATLTRKTWYLLGSGLSTLSIVVTAACSGRGGSVPLLYCLVVLASLATTFVGMSVESLVAYSTPEAQKGRAGGWLQAGNLGGGGIGGGAALWLAQSLPAWVPGAALGGCFVLCSLALLFVAEPRAMHHRQTIVRSMRLILKDLWLVTRSRSGYLALLVVFLPLGCGAAASIFPAVANEWHASARTVALASGTLGGILSAAGCLVGGYLSDRFDRKLAYVGYGLLLALCAIAMAVWPHTEASYFGFNLAYSFVTGVCFAGFTAVTLEAIGHGAAATKYNLFASLSNMPIAYLAALEGWAQTPWGTNGFLYVDAAIAVAGAVIFCAVLLLTSRRAEPLTA
jgi:MFS transporter, PAT family, beta-lactamase induction signal transducer AmpG